MRQFTGLLRSERFSAQSLRKTSVDGLSINDKDDQSLAGKPLTFVAEKLQGFGSTSAPLQSLNDSDAFMDAKLRDISDHLVSPVYWMNFSAVSTRLSSYVSAAPLNIHSAVHPYLGCSSEINAPTYCLAGRLSFTVLHLEDGCLDSCNLVHWGEQGAEKLWLFVCPSFNAALCALLRTKLDKLHAEGDNVPIGEGCPTPRHHKNITLTPSFLKDNGIPYQVVCQQPGTLVYVREGVYHQVLNTGLNLAGAVNVGGVGWNYLAHTFIPCACENCTVVAVPSNPGAYTTIRQHSCRTYEFSHPHCLNVASTAANGRQHRRVHGRGTAPGSLFACRLCLDVYTSEAFLAQHIRNRHPSGSLSNNI